MSWQGNKKNPVPNSIQDSFLISEKKIVVDRSTQTRRDNDVQKNFTVSLLDVDNAVLKQMESFQLQVIDEGNRIKVPVIYASPETWKSIQKDGYTRDYNGKLLLPGIALQRTTSDKDKSLMMFNRYLKYSVVKKYSEKNKYTPFNVLIGKNATINEVFDVVMPDHMLFTYKFIIWTEAIEQMNFLVERMNFESDDYWGEKNGFRFRTELDSFAHTTELDVENDRIIKTEFELKVHGYLLPDTKYGLDGNSQSTTQKWFTPKKVIITSEIMESEITFEDKSNVWKNQEFPNLDITDKIEAPPIVVENDFQTELSGSK